MVPSNSTSLEIELASATMALTRLDMLLHRHPLQAAWVHRQRLSTAARLSALDGSAVVEARLLGALAGLPLQGQRDAGALASALQILRVLQAGDALLRRECAGDLESDQSVGSMPVYDVSPAPLGPPLSDPAEHIIDQVNQALETMRRATDGRAPLVHVGIGLQRWIRSAKSERPAAGRIAADILLRELGVVVTPFPLPGYGGALDVSNERARNATEHDWLRTYLVSVRRSAEQGRQALSALETLWGIWHRRLGASRHGERRSRSRIEQVVSLAAATPILAPASVATRIGSTTRGAAYLLRQLADLNIVTELTGRQRGKAFTTNDLADVRDEVIRVPRRRRRYSEVSSVDVAEDVTDPNTPEFEPARAGAKEPPPPLDLDLGALLADTDRAIAKARAAIDAATDAVRSRLNRAAPANLSDSPMARR